MQRVGTSDSGEENLEPLKGLNILNVENDDSNRTLGIELEGISARLREDELLGSNTLSSPPWLCTDNSSAHNSSRYRNVSSDLDGDDYEILNILRKILEGSKEYETVIPDFKKRPEFMKDSASGLTTAENRL